MSSAERPVSKLPLLIMGAAVAMVVLAVVALIVTRGTAGYEPGTPEAALQEFLTAVLDEDDDAALALVTPELESACERALESTRFFDSDYRAELDDIEVTGGAAEAVVTLRSTNPGDPFDDSSWSFEARYSLEQVAGEWRVESADWPAPFDRCTRAAR